MQKILGSASIPCINNLINFKDRVDFEVSQRLIGSNSLRLFWYILALVVTFGF